MPVSLQVEQVDIAQLVAGGQDERNMHVLVSRPRQSRWLVALEPLDLHRRVAWGPVNDGDFVLVPLIPYVTHADAHKAILFAITLGLRAGIDATVPSYRDLERLYMVTGTVTEDLSAAGVEPTFRFHLGFAIQLH
jgi:hypothetical protein